jgi:hypothetical protein
VSAYCAYCKATEKEMSTPHTGGECKNRLLARIRQLETAIEKAEDLCLTPAATPRLEKEFRDRAWVVLRDALAQPS